MNAYAAVVLSLNFVETVVAVGDRKPKLILVSRGDEAIVNQAGVKVKGQRVVKLRRVFEQAEEIEALVAQLWFRLRDDACNTFAIGDGFSIGRASCQRWGLFMRRRTIKHLVRLPVKRPSSIVYATVERVIFDTEEKRACCIAPGQLG